MEYQKLSEQVQKLSNAQRSDAFVKLFRDAVRDGQFEAAYLPERFTLPKQYSRRGSEDTYQKDTKEMLFDVTPAFETWFEQTNRELAATRKGSTIKPTLENIESGLVDFKAMAAETRQKMQASYTKGQALGKSRSKAPPKKTVKSKRK
ncbi:hypothetical protein [Deinococcus yunweiensis]|uniref:hypothetical protein n=1 Tax=Deinococcus yunweiensis TaxID=367282 RepID=UPI00398E6C2D